MVREATDRNTLEQQELLEDLKSFSHKAKIGAYVAIGLLTLGVVLNVVLYLHIKQRASVEFAPRDEERKSAPSSAGRCFYPGSDRSGSIRHTPDRRLPDGRHSRQRPAQFASH